VPGRVYRAVPAVGCGGSSGVSPEACFAEVTAKNRFLFLDLPCSIHMLVLVGVRVHGLGLGLALEFGYGFTLQPSWLLFR